jgi:antitoxin MazE
MKARLIRIGNSRGIRIPRRVLEEISLEGDLELSVEDGALVVKPVRHPREGWEESFAEMARRGDDKLPDDWQFPNAFDEEEWEWQ